MTIDSIKEPADLRRLSYLELEDLAGEIRDFIVQAVATNSGHLGSNLGAVELTLALHRVLIHPPMPFCGTPAIRRTSTKL